MSRIFVVAALVTAALAAFAPIPSAWVESAYSQGVYLDIERHVTAWSNLVPFAIADLLILIALVIVALTVRVVWRRWRRKGAWAALLMAAATIGAMAACAYLLFLAMWGLNYRREPLATRLDFDRSRVTSGSVSKLTRTVVARLNTLSPRVHAGEWPAWGDLPAVIGPAYENVQRQLAPVTPALPGVPKWSVLTYYFQRAGVSGVTDPFALEVLVDRSQLPFERPFVAAHEWAHLAGYAVEAEANFIGWLVCVQGPPVAEYSGDLVLLMYLVGSMPPQEARATLAGLDAGVRADLAAIVRRGRQTWPWLQRPAWWIYDRYLRANRVEAGVRSYGLALQLIAGTRFEPAWVPVRRMKNEK